MSSHSTRVDLEHALHERYEPDVYPYLMAVAKARYKLFALILATGILSAIGTYFMPKHFTSQAIILPISSGSLEGPGKALSGSIGELSSLIGQLGSNLKSYSNQVLMAALQSRSITERVIEKEHLIEYFFPSVRSADDITTTPQHRSVLMAHSVRRMQKGNMQFRDSKKLPTLIIRGEFLNPELSYRVVTRYLAELGDFVANNSLTLEKRNRIFIEGQLQSHRIKMLKTAKNLAQFYELFGVSSRDSQLSVTISRDADDYPMASPLQPTKDSRDSETQNTEHSNRPETLRGVPQKVYYDYLVGESKVLEKLSGLLATQYELARIEEARENVAFQVIDEPEIPALKSWPPRMLITLILMVLMTISSIAYITSRTYIDRMRKMNPT